MQWAPDTSDKWAPDPGARNEWALESAAGPLTLGAAVEHFLTAPTPSLGRLERLEVEPNDCARW